jgi:hypothetical protein
VRFIIAIFVSVYAYGAAFATYDLQDFILWDYRDAAPNSVTLPKYHEWLLTYCETNAPPRLILYVTDPCNPDPTGTQNWFQFYNPAAGLVDTDGNLTFVGFLTQLQPHVSDVEILIDSASFSNSVSPNPANSCWNGSPSGESMEPTWLPQAFSRLPNAMGWLEAIMNNSYLQGANPVTSFCFDPEGSGGTPAYINILLWMDKYKETLASNQVKALDVSMTLAFEAHTVVKVCVAELPASSDSSSPWPLDLWQVAQNNNDLSSYFSKLQSNAGYLPWRPASTNPLLDRAYLQVYSACVASRTPGQSTSELWRFAATSSDCDCTATETYTIQPSSSIASNLVDVMQRTPAACGLGAIEATVDGSQVHLTGTNSILPFMEGYTRLVLEGAGAPIPSSGVWKYLSGYPPVTDEAVVSGPLESSNSQSLPYKYTEISIDFRAPSMTDSSPDRIILMFSAEKEGLLPFFGWGTPSEYYSFIEAFYNATQATSAASTVFVGKKGGIPVKNNRFGIYELKQICENWGIDSYGVLTCVGDGTQDGQVNLADILHAISFWGTSEEPADHDGNGVVGIGDLLIIVHSWGDC